MSRGLGLLRALVGLVPLVLTGCFIGYDSRWGQQKQVQKHVAAARMPSHLGSPDSAPPHGMPRPVRTMRIRLEPTPAHTAQVVDYERHFQRALDEANGVLETALAVHLEVVGTRAFRPETGEDHIQALLDELRRADTGDDVDWVIGLAGSVPRFEDSFHELGLADVIGKHLVVRALNNVAEYEAIQQGFTELSEAEREKLARARLEHKGAVVLLHELGHTLGALHELDKTSIMSARYAASAHSFAPDTLELMRAVLARRAPSGELEAEGREAVVELLRREPAPWVPVERDTELARLTSAAASPAPAAKQAPAAATNGLPPSDDVVFQEATRRLERGDTEGALEAAAPLFARYPKVAAVAELRCNIALRRGGSYERIRDECAGVPQGGWATP